MCKRVKKVVVKNNNAIMLTVADEPYGDSPSSYYVMEYLPDDDRDKNEKLKSFFEEVLEGGFRPEANKRLISMTKRARTIMKKNAPNTTFENDKECRTIRVPGLYSIAAEFMVKEFVEGNASWGNVISRMKRYDAESLAVYERKREKIKNADEKGIAVAATEQMPDADTKPEEERHGGRTPVTITYRGMTMTIRQWSNKTGIKVKTLRARYNAGKKGDDLFMKVAKITKETATKPEITEETSMCKTYITMSKAAKVLEIPEDMIEFTFKKYEKADDLKKDVDYIVFSGEKALTLSGILWVVNRCDVNFRGAVSLINTIIEADNKKDDTLRNGYKELLAKLEDVKAGLSLASEAVDNAVKSAIPVDGEPDKKEKRYTYINSRNLPDLTDEEKAWGKKTYDRLESRAVELGMLRVHLQSALYRYMTRTYGIVFDQEKADYLDANGLPRVTPITTFRVIQCNGKLRSLFGSCLENFRKAS